MCNNCYQSGLEWKSNINGGFIDSRTGIKYPVETSLQVPKEMEDWKKVLEMGAKKYTPNNWLEKEGKNCDEKSMHASMFRHLAESSSMGSCALDKESNLDPLLHLACRALMLYTRRQKGIK